MFSHQPNTGDLTIEGKRANGKATWVETKIIDTPRQDRLLDFFDAALNEFQVE